jgi:hypothetical protein
MGKVISGLGKLAGKVSEVAGKVIDFGGKALSIIQKPLDVLTSPIKKLAGGLLDKLPLGLGNFLKPVVEKLIDSAAGFLAGGPLGGVGILTKAAKTVGEIVKVAETVKGVADKVGALANPVAQGNFQQLVAAAHGGLVE